MPTPADGPQPSTSARSAPAPSDATLERNLAALAGANPGLAERIRDVVAAELRFAIAADGTPVADHLGRPLASRHRPLEEAEALVGEIDLAEKAVIVLVGFGLGWHVRRLCERMERAGLVAVYESDLGLLKAVLSTIDHSAWIRRTNLVLLTDVGDRSDWSRRFHGLDALLVQGVRFVEHPASRARLGGATKEVGERIAELVRAAKMSMGTTLVRSVATGNAYLGNIAWYAAGPGCAELKDCAKGRLGIVVSAGPSLRRNIAELARPGVRERCVIVATQTTLRPLLEAGVRPHIVCALDWHHISTRFYESIRPEDVADTTLVLDPQANPLIAKAYPGPVRVFNADFLAMVLGPAARDMGCVQTGNTVAHLCYSVARWLGCDPVALIGQDLGFTDGLYYARGTAIDDVWAPELNPFNTVEMMEWQRIMRHRPHLRRARDVHGRSIYTDSQMEGYLNRFEAMFAADRAAGLSVIDATEGGVAKAGAEIMTLAAALEAHGREDPRGVPVPLRRLDAELLRVGAARVRSVLREVGEIRVASERTATILAEMLEHQRDAARMERLFPRLDRERAVVERLFATFQIVNHFNQLGAFKRAKADRRLHFARGLEPLEAQRAQLERDLVNVRWTADAARELEVSLEAAIARLEGRQADDASESDAEAKAEAALRDAAGEIEGGRGRARVGFVVAVDPTIGGTGTLRALDSELAGRSVLQRTLERLGRSREAERILLLVPESFDPEPLIDPRTVGLPLVVERCGASVFGPEREAIAAARLWSDASWRGGIAGMSVYDEVVAPIAAHAAMERHGLSAAVFVGPDWPCVQVDAPGGCDDLIRRHRSAPERHSIVFTQSPPGLCGILLDRDLVGRMRAASRLSTVGALLVWQPHLPQPDPISLDVCVPIDPRVRRSLIRAVFDSPRAKIRMRRGLEPLINDADQHGRPEPLDAATVVAALEAQIFDTVPYFGPQHVQLELCTGRQGSGAASPHRWGSIQRLPMTLKRVERIVQQLAESGDAILTLGGVGDPLNHPDVDRVVRMAKEAGVRGVHVRTELLAPRATIDRLLDAPVDVVSVDLHATTREGYRAMMGVDRFDEARANLEHLVMRRRHVSGPAGWEAMALPWVCPRLQRRVESYEELDGFFDVWSRLLGTPVLEGPMPFDPAPGRREDPLASARPPARVAYRELHRRMTILSDGAVPLGELDLHGEQSIGHVDRAPVVDLWRQLVNRRRQLRREEGAEIELLRIRTP